MSAKSQREDTECGNGSDVVFPSSLILHPSAQISVIVGAQLAARTQSKFEYTAHDVVRRSAIATLEAMRHLGERESVDDEAAANFEGLDFYS